LAKASGKFATAPIRMQHTPAAKAVHAIDDCCGTPAPARIAGLAKRMYAIVRNVARPPRTSRATVESRDRMSKKSMMRFMGMWTKQSCPGMITWPVLRTTVTLRVVLSLMANCRSRESASMKQSHQFSFLALGDSYTIGEKVAESARWPVVVARALRD